MAVNNEGRLWAARANHLVAWFSRHWLFVFTLLLGVFIGLPWLAPVFMKLGWTNAADNIYFLYSLQCHQMPQRSFFLFGDKVMYSLPEIQSAWQNSYDPLVLRQFNGNADMGWKVAWSDRMVYMYTALLFFGIAFWPLRKRLKGLPLWGLILFLLPMGLDGMSHMISDILGGVGGGFRYSNEWLALLTNDLFPSTFYVGDALGSFNAMMRFMSGALFGLGIVWFAYPRMQAAFAETSQAIEDKFQRAEERAVVGD